MFRASTSRRRKLPSHVPKKAFRGLQTFQQAVGAARRELRAQPSAAGPNQRSVLIDEQAEGSMLIQRDGCHAGCLQHLGRGIRLLGRRIRGRDAPRHGRAAGSCAAGIPRCPRRCSIRMEYPTRQERQDEGPAPCLPRRRPAGGGAGTEGGCPNVTPPFMTTAPRSSATCATPRCRSGQMSPCRKPQISPWCCEIDMPPRPIGRRSTRLLDICHA